MIGAHSNEVFCQGDANDRIHLHSTAKLIQCIPVLLLQLDKFYNLTMEEISIMASSHIGQEAHITVLDGLMQKFGLLEEDFILQPAYPAGRIAYTNWMRNQLPKNVLYHPCVGNHIALMLAQRALTGSVKGYEKTDGSVQRMVLNLTSEICECAILKEQITTDGCGIPTYQVPIRQLAVAYRNLLQYSEKNHSELECAIHKIIASIHSAPVMLEGDGCLSTEISRDVNWFAKTGQGGLLAAASSTLNCGIAIKAGDGKWSTICELVWQVLQRFPSVASPLEKRLQKVYSFC